MIEESQPQQLKVSISGEAKAAIPGLANEATLIEKKN